MPEMSVFYNNPNFRRKYQQALLRIADGPLQVSAYGTILEARYRALLANGLTFTSPYANSGAQNISIPTWIQQRRANIYTSLRTSTNVAFALTSPSTVTSSSNQVTFSGTAPLLVKTIKINGQEYPINWTSVTAWSLRLPLGMGTNQLAIQAYDRDGNLLPNLTTNATVIYNGPVPEPKDFIVINEIMFAPTIANAEYVEIYNTSPTYTFDLAGWRMNGLDYVFPKSSFLGPRSGLVLAKDAAACLLAYGGSFRVFDVFVGNLQAEGETLTLHQTRRDA